MHASLFEAAADPGFPVGGGTDLRCGHFSAETCAKMKELGPVGGTPPWIHHWEGVGVGGTYDCKM